MIGQRLGDYVVEGIVAQGGMGIIYQATHPILGRRAAVKVLRADLADNSEQVERFIREARALSSLKHRAIVEVFGFGDVADGRHYLLTEFLEGESLDRAIAREAPFSTTRALEIFEEILEALSAAHAADIVHRDLKPSNIFLAKQTDGSSQIKVIDFGLAKRRASESLLNSPAKASLLAGTPEYISPEQIEGTAVTPASDLYSAGIVLFEMLTGRLPFTGKNVVEILQNQLAQVAPKVSQFVPTVPPTLDRLVDELLQKKPESRPRAAAGVAARVARLVRELTSTPAPHTRPIPLVATTNTQAAETVPAVSHVGQQTELTTQSVGIGNGTAGAATTALPARRARLPVWRWVAFAAASAAAGIGLALFLPRQAPPVHLDPHAPAVSAAQSIHAPSPLVAGGGVVPSVKEEELHREQSGDDLVELPLAIPPVRVAPSKRGEESAARPPRPLVELAAPLPRCEDADFKAATSTSIARSVQALKAAVSDGDFLGVRAIAEGHSSYDRRLQTLTPAECASFRADVVHWLERLGARLPAENTLAERSAMETRLCNGDAAQQVAQLEQLTRRLRQAALRTYDERTRVRVAPLMKELDTLHPQLGEAAGSLRCRQIAQKLEKIEKKLSAVKATREP